MRVPLFPLLCALLMLAAGAGCTSAGGTSAPEAPPLGSGEVVFYESEAEVPGEYEVVEVITPPPHIAREGSGYEGTGAVRRYALRRAAALGANAVLRVSTAEADSDSRAVTAVRNGYTLAQTHLVAIRVLPRPTSSR